MGFQDLLSQIFRAPQPLDSFAKLKDETGRSKPKKADLDEALSELSEAIVRNKKGNALSVARALLLLLGPDRSIKRIQREGIFRASRHAFSNSVVQVLITDWTENAVIYGFNEAHVNYLRSAGALWTLAPALNKMRRSLVARLKSKRAVAIKTLLANVDAAFTFGMPGNKELPTDSPQAYSSESMAEAFSYLLRLFHQEVGVEKAQFRMVDDSSVFDTFYQDLLLDAARVCEYLEAEVLIDAFPYSARVKDSSVTVSADDPTLEKSIRLGYVQSDMQKMIRLRGLIEHENGNNKEILSVTSFAKTFYGKLGEVVVTFVPEPVPRYTMALPLLDELHQMFAGNGLFVEDLSSIEMLGTEDYVDPSKIVDSPVVGNITVIDILKVQRFFYFMQFGLKAEIDRHLPVVERPRIYFNSCLPVFERKKLIEILKQLIGDEMAEEMLRLLTCDLSSEYVDLQYTPVIVSGEWCILSLAVLSASNLVRNILCHSAERLTMRNKEDGDPMQIALKDALRQAGFLVEDEVDTGTKNNKLEVDVLAYRDGHLFLFECKNSFHPCNVYEMRTSYDHVVHAADQLSKRKAWLLDHVNQRRVFDRLAWNASATDRVHTCIAIGNRVFSGYDCEGHPVRQVHELLNVLLRGYIVIEDVTRRVWKSERLSVADVCSYLDGETTVADFMECMRPLDRTLSFGDAALTFSSYVLDAHKLTGLSESKYPRVGSALESTDFSTGS
ncbi:MAG: hypothetical protein GAK33_03496 [Burkholderia lata]|uniref:NERD domain-containing protein n=1 Tax=Burkholderia lata (strain ATCC 17760 / DSM 23089 / LMG 22485 / NCIMB 9086 / R18194 / 383) TaxID=482957 RepID=A0A833PV32_BURL3|nr:hypothetical protein [Burkholderia lata]KAF1037012.1 MAG: hypothetical protein GAK33_03496 [Burkholderia lata]